MLNLKDSLKSVVFIIAGGIIFCALFLYNNVGGMSASGAPQEDKGRVLGVSEQAFPEPEDSGQAKSQDTFPASESKATPSEPVLRPNAPGLELNECESAILLDSATGERLYEQSSDRISSVASITKLATALVFIQSGIDLDKIYEVDRSDLVSGGRIYLSAGEKVKARDLLHLTLVGSANSAARALASATGYTEEEFAKRMNSLASGLGLAETRFVDPAGLWANNVSTAGELAVLVKEALKHPEISQALLTQEYKFKTLDGRSIRVVNTDRLLSNFPRSGIELAGGKTGYTKSAGYCFAGKFTDKEGNSVISVVLGGQDFNSRFSQTEKMVNWAYRNYEW